MRAQPNVEPRAHTGAANYSPAAGDLRRPGIANLGLLPWGTHFCQFYETSQDLVDVLVPFFLAGLQHNEFCMWVTCEPLRAEDARAALRQAVPDLEEHLQQDRIEILDYRQWYTPSGKFDADRVLAAWIEKEQQARQRGYEGLRLTGNTFWLEQSDWKNFTEYEALVDSAIKDRRMIALCTYAVQKCSAVEVIEVVNNHQFAIVKRAGQWEMMESRQRKRAEAGVAQRSALLEGINRIFREALACRTEEQLGQLCLGVAETVTGSKCGVLGKINPQTELLDDITISDRGGELCRVRAPAGDGETSPIGDALQGICGRMLGDGKAFFTNDPPWPADGAGVPEGRPPLKAFLGVPLLHDDKTIGVVAVGNREGGYRHEDLEALQALAIPIVQVLMRRRAEEQIRQLNQELEERVSRRTELLRAVNKSLQREIAERTKLEEARFRLAAIVESSEDAIASKTLDGVVTSWNRGAERIYGYSAAEMIGTSIAMLTPEDRAEEVPSILEEIRRGRHVEHYETVRQRKDGQRIIVSLTASPIRGPSGQIIGAATIARDITQQKQLEEGVRSASSYARSLIEASLDPLVTISPAGKVTDVNKATEDATGVPRQGLIGSDFSGYFTEPQKANAGYQKVISQGYVRDYPLTMRHVSGRTMDVLYNATLYRNDQGQVQGVFAAARDITDRKRMDEELRAASLYARSLIEASLDPLVTISPAGKITDVNRATELATGVVREALIGRDFAEYFTAPEKASAGYQKVLADGWVSDYPLTIRHASGRTTDVLYNATVYRNEAGEVQGVFAAARDITARKRAEEELDRYREHLEELVAQRTEELARSNRDLEQFAYVASHDLQEPLRMVAGYLQLLSERYRGRLDEKADKFIDYAVDGAERMSGLIRDLLAYSRVNTRGEQFGETSTEEALDFALRNLASAIQESRAVVRHDPLPAVRADQPQLRQLFQNLVGNAVKFRSPERTAVIEVSARQDTDCWLFTVKDNGIGFDDRYQDKMFLIFQRLHRRGQYPGTGIGLAICKRIVERHGGRIWATGQPGQGAAFHFTIPIGGNS